jgi:hypothetical protein
MATTSGYTDADYEDEIIPLLHCVADVREMAVTDLPPIQDTVDGDLLRELLESDFPGSCTFRYAGCEIVITGDRPVRVEELDSSDE